MKYNELISRLQNLINYIPEQSELCKITGIKQTTMSNRANRNSGFSSDEIEKINNKYNINLFTNKKDDSVSNVISFTSNYKPLSDIIQIPYWSGLPEELKHPEYACVMAQRISIEQGWELKPENLCIVPMVGDKMTNYWYKINDGDILIIDTSKDHIVGNGVYFATSQNNTRFWIREMQVLVNGDMEFKGFAPSGNTARVVKQEELQKVGFKIIGKVIKNVSFRL